MLMLENVPFSSRYPIELAHGKYASFMQPIGPEPNWLGALAKDFRITEKSVKTLVIIVFTSLGESVEVHPASDFLELLMKAR
jgi:hypothetical protein